MLCLNKLSKKELSDKICLLRLDLNLKSLRDSFRLDAVLPTLKFLLKNHAKILILSHRGRPIATANGKWLMANRQFSLQPIGKILSKKLGRKIIFLGNFDPTHNKVMRGIKKQLEKAKPGTIFLLENLRFLKGEKENSASLAKKLAALGNLYVNDAFAVSHRADASVASITKFIKSYAGLLLEKEIKYLSYAMKNPKKPFVVIIGGAKISDKIGVIKNLWRPANCFLVGSSALNADLRGLNTDLRGKIMMPFDSIKIGNKNFDIGPKTAAEYQKIIGAAKTIVWNGPLGMIEDKRYANGTVAIAKAIAKSKVFSIAGGGETTNFILKLKLQKKIKFLSTGGGAMLDFLAGKKLLGIAALEMARK